MLSNLSASIVPTGAVPGVIGAGGAIEIASSGNSKTDELLQRLLTICAADVAADIANANNSMNNIDFAEITSSQLLNKVSRQQGVRFALIDLKAVELSLLRTVLGHIHMAVYEKMKNILAEFFDDLVTHFITMESMQRLIEAMLSQCKRERMQVVQVI
jgi:hypothetical protein